MSKKIIQTPEESALYYDLQRLIKRANQRLLRAERLTGEQGTFASKQLYDYLSTSELNAISKTGRVRLSKSYNTNKMTKIKKAVEEYLAEDTSKTSGIKKYREEASKETGSELDFKQASTLFQVKYNYQWIYEYYAGSEFWKDYGNQAKKKEINETAFVESIFNEIKSGELANKIPDEKLREDLINLYYYCRKDAD